MKKRSGKIIVSAAGGTAGKNAVTYKVSLPTVWLNELGINADNRELELSFDGTAISIKKKQTVDDFVSQRKKMGHLIKLYSFYDSEKICTSIYADHTDKSVFAVNHTDKLVKTAFGRKEYPSWENFCSFIEERCIPKGRSGLREYLECIGLDEYDPFEIIRKTQGRMAEDSQWIKVEDI